MLEKELLRQSRKTFSSSSASLTLKSNKLGRLSLESLFSRA
jgi:hypothetical protein